MVRKIKLGTAEHSKSQNLRIDPAQQFSEALLEVCTKQTTAIVDNAISNCISVMLSTMLSAMKSKGISITEDELGEIFQKEVENFQEIVNKAREELDATKELSNESNDSIVGENSDGENK